MGFKRGQAAMEYLMTYGWAILVIVIVLAALLYLGVFNLASKTPDICNFQTGLSCKSTYVVNPATMTVNFINGYQRTITVVGTYCTTQTTGAPAAAQYTAVAYSVGVGSNWSGATTCYQDLTHTAATTLKAGDALVGRLWVSYYYNDEGAGQTRTNPADFKATAQ